jgi:hypothetical protein
VASCRADWSAAAAALTPSTPDSDSRTRAAECQTCSTTPLTHKASPADVARIAAVVASDFRFAYFGTAAFAVRLLRLDQKLMDGIPMNPRRMANTLNTKL